MSAEVAFTPELERILAIQRRTVTPELAEQIADHLTARLKTPGGQQRLKPLQAVALWEAMHFGGVFGPIQVGYGKTLITALLGEVMQKSRPLLFVPAALVGKTKREFLASSEHWRFDMPRIMGYQLLSHAKHADDLESYEPDLIIADEAHKLKNPDTSITRRVSRYMAQHPNTAFVPLSGTMTKRSLLDFAHLLAWALKMPPIPRFGSEIEVWSDALDERVTGINSTAPGELIRLCNDEERQTFQQYPREGARRAFRRRLVETPGVVATTEQALGASLIIKAQPIETLDGGKYKPNVHVENAFEILRKRWELPDGHGWVDGLEQRRHARELALGFYYRWNPRPPPRWMLLRRLWHRFVRGVILYSQHQLDSERHVADAIEAGDVKVPTVEKTLNDNDKEAIRKSLLPGDLSNDVRSAWLGVKNTFEPNNECIWLDDFALRACEAWAKRPGIIWVEHVEFGEMLAKRTGMHYFRKEDPNRPIENEPTNRAIIASIASNMAGRNLQHWDRNLLTSIPSSGLDLEQLLARTHRPGQKSDEVHADILLCCNEHIAALAQARRDAQYQDQITGSPQKLLYCDLDVQTRGADRSYRWSSDQ